MTTDQHRDIRIRRLVDTPAAAPVLAAWFAAEWAPWYGPEGPGDAAADLAACSSREALPICLVALGAADQVLGTAALKAESVGSELGVEPWLAALLVGADHRGRGVGTALIAAIEAEAWRLGFPALYTSTDSAEGLLLRRGWQAIGSSESLRGAVAVYRLGRPVG